MAYVVIVALGVSFIVAWREDRKNLSQLKADLATANQSLQAATARQHDRDFRLQQTLTALAREKRSATTPAEIVQKLPAEISLPLPITLQTLPPPVLGSTQPAQPEAVIPAEDLKPLHDFVLDCKACQAKLAASQADLADETSKTQTLTRERDEALKIARGGSAWHRVARAAKWFVLGAAAGAIAVKTAH